MMTGWFSYNLESQEFSIRNRTPQKLLIIIDFGCSVYQMPPGESELNSNQLRLDTKAMKLQQVLSFPYSHQSLPYCCWVLFSSYSNTCMGGKCACQMTASKAAKCDKDSWSLHGTACFGMFYPAGFGVSRENTFQRSPTRTEVQ